MKHLPHCITNSPHAAPRSLPGEKADVEQPCHCEDFFIMYGLLNRVLSNLRVEGASTEAEALDALLDSIADPRPYEPEPCPFEGCDKEHDFEAGQARLRARGYKA